MKKVAVIIIILMLTACAFLFACDTAQIPSEPYEPPKLKVYTVIYTPGQGGIISGNNSQIIKEGKDANTVTAIPNTGYRFLKWSDSDNIDHPTRTDLNVTANISATAEFERLINGVTYIAKTGGSISGKTSQTVAYGESAEEVTAVPDKGHIFKKWSDGNDNAARQDTNIKSALSFSAEFEAVTKSYNYNYNDATANDTEKSATLQYGKLQDSTLVVPEREGFVFKGWFTEWYCAKQVSDGQGNITAGNEIFDSKSSNLYAKWTDVNEAKYKILMVFVTEAHATLTTKYGGRMSISYKMSDIERQICGDIAEMFGQYLNALQNGAVTYEVDTYYTTVPVGEESFNLGTIGFPNGKFFYDNKILAYDIPEVSESGILDNYRSVITTFGMNDYDGMLHLSAGGGGVKHASIHTESIFGGLVVNNQPLEYLNNLELKGIPKYWEGMMDLYLHEFTHTVDMSLWFEVPEFQSQHLVDYHGTLKHYSLTVGSINGAISELEVLRLFLTRQADIDGKPAGIPLWFWRGESMPLLL